MVDSPTYVDVNIFVYWLGNHPKFGDSAHMWIQKIENTPGHEYVTSSLTLYEALVIIAGLSGKNLKDPSFVNELIASLTSIRGLKIEPLEPADLISAVDLMKEYRIDYEDAIHLAVAIRKGAKEIVSNDKDFDATPIKRTI